MAQSDWVTIGGSLGTGVVDRGVTAGIAPPTGGGSFVYGFNSLDIGNGAVVLSNTQVNFAPMVKGGSVRAAMKRGLGGGLNGFAPFLFIGLPGVSPTVADVAYMLGLSDGDPNHIVLRKGPLNEGIPDSGVDPDGDDGILLRSTDGYDVNVWHHLRLDMIVQGNGDVLLQCFRNAGSVAGPTWVAIPGMEGPLSPAISGFVDDALAVNTGTAPILQGRAGFGFWVSDVTRRAFFDHIEVLRQL